MKARPQRAIARGASPEQARRELAGRLRERRPEIEEALLTRTYAIADPKEAADPEYEQGLRAAVSAALEYGLATVEHGEERTPQVPVLLLAQARLAARNGVPLDTVLRRYFAGYTLLGDFIVQEAGAVKLGETGLKLLLRDQAAMFDRFLVEVSEEYSREGDTNPASTRQRQAQRVERLLEGELVDTSDLGYDLNRWHVGIAAAGPTAAETARSLAGQLDCQLLLVSREEGNAWAWLGSRRRREPSELMRIASASSEQLALAFGEPAHGLTGWRLTHRQAAAAMSVAQRRGKRPVRYADVPILASALSDDLLVTSLRELYLRPMERERDGGVALRRTLRAYFAAGQNVSSTAASLEVKRHTVTNRLRAVEEMLGQPIDSCAAELETALQLDDLADLNPAVAP